MSTARVWILLAFIAAIPLSIAAAQILLAVSAAAWIADLVWHRRPLSAPTIWVPLAWYGAITLVSAAFSLHPAVSLVDCKQLALFVIVPIVYDTMRGRAMGLAVVLLLASGCVAASVGLIQYERFNLNSIDLRPHGTLGHYMTFSGQLMLGGAMALSYALFGHRLRVASGVACAWMALALLVTFTRSAWLGALAATILLLWMRDRRLLVGVPLIAGLVYAFAPPNLEARMRTILSLEDRTGRERVLLVQSGARMICDHPWLGVGPNMVQEVYPRYRLPGVIEPVTPHLHNNFVQIAAERGVLALGVWLWFVVRTMRTLRSLATRPGQTALARGALAAMVALLVAGLFEYNAGDSEVLMLLLVLITLPFAAARTDEADSPPRDDRSAAL